MIDPHVPICQGTDEARIRQTVNHAVRQYGNQFHVEPMNVDKKLMSRGLSVF